MYKLLLLTLLTTLLLANNPKPYAALGDIIYDNASKIQSLQDISIYELYKDDISTYLKNVADTKKEGFQLELGKAEISKRDYLKKLRKLSQTNDYFLRSITNNYKESMNNNNYELFSQMINSGLIDTSAHKKEIIDYYYEHEKDINASGVIKNFLDEDAKLKALKEAQKKRYKTKKELEAEKIKRIRENDKRKQAALEKRLQEDVNHKKLEIREEQKKELAN